MTTINCANSTCSATADIGANLVEPALAGLAVAALLIERRYGWHVMEPDTRGDQPALVCGRCHQELG